MTYAPPPHLTQNWRIGKPAASGRRGIVVSQARDAALAGIATLDAGGNAIDAAIATALALCAVEPWNSGLGAVGFALVHRAGQPQADLVDFGPRAPASLDPARFRLTGRIKQDLFAWPEVEDDANIHGPLSFAIPSTVAGLAHMHGRWGTLPLSTIMAPAIALARRGLPATWFTTLKIANAAAILRRYPESARIYLPGDLPPIAPYQGTPGYLPLGRLADTHERLSTAGLRDIYEGDVAAALVQDCRAMDAMLSADDLRRCEASTRPAEQLPWRGRTLQHAGGLTAGPTLARVLALLGDTWPATPDAAWFARLAQSLRTAYAERLAGLGDPEPPTAETCTTHLTVCDESGTMVALTTTLLSSMGSRVVLPATGILMNNGVMWFDPHPGQPNSMAPGKRPLTNMLPIILRDGPRPILAAGASGGRRILPAITQMLAFTAGFGMDPETAAHHPRIDVSGPDEVSANARLAPAILDALHAEIVEHSVLPVNFACPNLILDQAGARTGISDVMTPGSAAIAQA